MKQLIWGRIAQIILAFIGAYNFYQALFAFWMTASPFADPNLWRHRFHVRAAVALATAAVLIPLTLWIGRRSRRMKALAKGQPRHPAR
jgi:hypothetical protein